MNPTGNTKKRDSKDSKSRNDTTQMLYIYSILGRFFTLILTIIFLTLVIKTLMLSYQELKLRLGKAIELNPARVMTPFDGYTLNL